MNTERSDAEYIIIGKIAEKRKDFLKLKDELLKLKEELQALEEARKNIAIEEDVFEGTEETIEFHTGLEEEVPPVEEEVVIQKKPLRKPISYELKLELINDDYQHASNVSRGNVFVANDDKKVMIPAWTNGRKYDPCKGKMLKIRNELRKGPMTIRQMSVFTGYALDTIKDYVKELDKQGFFKNT
jgi:hypothetical protein